DVESIATHEAGHFLGLAHTPDVNAVMYATYPLGAIKRNLDPGTDVRDICGVYPADAGLGTQGTFCLTDQDCGSTAPICRGPADAGSICTVTCPADGGCPTNYQCLPANIGAACLLPPAV